MSTRHNYNRILIVKLSSIGDVVMASPVAKALRTAFPESHIAWVVEERSRDAVTGNPYLDEVIVWKRSTGSRRPMGKAVRLMPDLSKLGRELRQRKFDVAIDLQGLLRSALVTLVSGAPQRVGYEDAGEGAAFFYNVRMPAPGPDKAALQYYLDLLQPLGVFSEDREMHMPIAEEDRTFARSLIAETVSDHAVERRRIAGLCPATTWSQKHWTEEGWARLADALVSDYDVVPVFLGSRADVPLIGRIRALMRHSAVDAAGKTTLKQAAAVLDQADMTVAVDTGLLHISLALDRPTIGIFGPTRWQHLVKKDNFLVVTKEFPCMPCLRHPTCEGFDCMSAVTADDVLAAARYCLAPAQA